MRKEIEDYITTWESRCYSNGLPDDVPKEIFDMVPSYKKIAMAILKNDLTVIGVPVKHSSYYDALKRIELKERHEKLLTNI